MTYLGVKDSVYERFGRDISNSIFIQDLWKNMTFI